MVIVGDVDGAGERTVHTRPGVGRREGSRHMTKSSYINARPQEEVKAVSARAPAAASAPMQADMEECPIPHRYELGVHFAIRHTGQKYWGISVEGGDGKCCQTSRINLAHGIGTPSLPDILSQILIFSSSFTKSMASKDIPSSRCRSHPQWS